MTKKFNKLGIFVTTLLFSFSVHAVEYGLIDLADIPTGMTSTVRVLLPNTAKKAAQITRAQLIGQGFSANLSGCRSIPGKKECTFYMNFDSSGQPLGPKSGYLTVSLSSGVVFEFSLKARVTRALQTPMGDKEAEDFFNAQLVSGKTRLDYLLKTKSITSAEHTKALSDLTDYRNKTFSYTQFYFQECRSFGDDFSALADSEYAYRIKYLGGLLRLMIGQPTATLNQITPEVADFVQARKSCNYKGEDLIKCTRKVIDQRIAKIYQSIDQNNPQNPAPYKNCANLGVQAAKVYGALVGTFHHLADLKRRQEVLDIEDKLVMFTYQDLDEGY